MAAGKRARAIVLFALLIACLGISTAMAQEAGAEASSDPASTTQAEDKAPEVDAQKGDQAAAEPLDSGYFEEVRVDVLQLNFIAVDRKGRPITDLRPDELEVELNGDPVRIAFLDRNAASNAEVTTREETRRERKRRESRSKEDDGELQRVRPAASERSDQRRRWIVFFFDSYTAGPRTRIKSIDAASKWMLEERQPNDQIAIVDFNGKLKLLQPFTDDGMAIQEALNKVMEATPMAFADRHDQLQTLQTTFDRCARKGAAALQCVQPYIYSYEADRLRERRNFIDAILLLTRSMAPIPHIKSIIMFSDGFSRVPGQDALDVATSVLGFEATMRLNLNYRADIDIDYQEITEAASRAKVSVHTIMPGGGKSFGFISAAQASPIDETRGSKIDYFARSAKNYQQGFTELALRTGGAISLNADPELALDKVIDQTRALYTLGVYSSGTQAYRNYRFKIKCSRRGVRIRTWETVPRLKLPLRLKGEIEATPGTCKPGERRALDLRVKVNREQLTFKAIPGGSSANFSVYVTMYAPGKEDPVFEKYRFFNISRKHARFDEDGGLDPEMTERFLVPCTPLVITAHVTDAERGSMGKLVTSIDQ